jgi:predicted enzyme related to lactoylglutathione lyase
MAATADAPTASGPAPIDADLMIGAIIEVRDLAETRAFYERIFRDRLGEWRQAGKSLSYRYGPQTIEFVQKTRPRTVPDGGFHHAYRVKPANVERIAQELQQAGAEVSWWREDRPEERNITAYVHDPSGNIVQLVGSDDGDLLLDHAAIEVHAYDYCEHLYAKTLGGRVSYYHGWRVEDEADAKRWGAGDDPCAPWTRRDNPGWYDLVGHKGPASDVRVPRPVTQVFVSFGKTPLGMISASKVRQELPEEIIRATPRLVFRTKRSPEAAFGRIAEVFPMPFEHDERTAYIRDPDGNFLELRCEG